MVVMEDVEAEVESILQTLERDTEEVQPKPVTGGELDMGMQGQEGQQATIIMETEVEEQERRDTIQPQRQAEMEETDTSLT